MSHQYTPMRPGGKMNPLVCDSAYGRPGRHYYLEAIAANFGGTDVWNRSETGNNQNGGFSRTLTATGSNGVSFTQTANGNFLNGKVERT